MSNAAERKEDIFESV